MGSSYSEEEDDKEEEKELNKKQEEIIEKDKIKQKDETLILVSSKNPINNNNHQILAENIYLDKKSNLGKKRQRPEDSNNQQNINKEEIINEDKKIKKNKDELNENKFKKNNIYLKEEQNIKAEYIGQKKFKKLEIEPSLNVNYSNEKIKINKNEIDNAINFSIDKLYDNKIESEEKMKKKIINPCNSYMLLKNDDENIDIDEMEEKKNNSEEKPKQIIDNIFVFPSQNSKIENKIIKIPQQSENEIKEKENINNSKQQEDIYSYECLTKHLYVRGVKGIKELFIDITINNSGKLDWPKDNIFLKSDNEYSQIPSKEIKIISLKTGWTSEERIVFNNLENKLPGLYKSYIYLNINGRKYGKPIIIQVEILENEEEKKINNLINKMRKEYQIPPNEINDEKKKNALINNNFDVIKAFEYLFGDQ